VSYTVIKSFPQPNRSHFNFEKGLILFGIHNLLCFDRITNDNEAFIAGIGAFVELCVEPAYVLAQSRRLYGLRVKVESLAIFMRCVASYTFLVHFRVLFENM
jgi:hypothetical protein